MVCVRASNAFSVPFDKEVMPGNVWLVMKSRCKSESLNHGNAFRPAENFPACKELVLLAVNRMGLHLYNRILRQQENVLYPFPWVHRRQREEIVGKNISLRQ